MQAKLKAIQQTLILKSDPSNLPFFERVVPGNQKKYGVKTPELNILAKEYKDGGFELVKLLWHSGALEEKVIAIKILEQIGKKDPGMTLSIVKQFAKTIDNWAVCDGLGMQALRGVRTALADEIFELAAKFNASKDPWQRRLSLVMVEWYTRDQSYHTRINELVKNLKDDKEYYVKKAVQWIERNLKKKK